MTPEEYNLRSAAWKACQDTMCRLHTSGVDTEAVLGDLVAKLQTIRQELHDERRAMVYQGAIAKVEDHARRFQSAVELRAKAKAVKE